MTEQRNLLTVSEVAKELGVHDQTVRRWLRTGWLKGTLITRQAGYRINRSELERVLTEGIEEGKELAAA